MNRGYIKLWRRIEDSAVFQNEGLFKLFVWCLLRANHKESFVKVKTGRGFTEIRLSPGSFLFGRESAARELHMSPSTVWKRMLKLKNLEILNIESNSHYSTITIINWGCYQYDQNEGDREGNRQGTGKEHRQECKNYKNNKTFLSDSIEIRLSEQLFNLICAHNPKAKKPNFQTWAKHIDLAIRIDGRTPDELEAVIQWCQKDSFWHSNILSTAKLRKQFDQLNLKMKGTGKANNDDRFRNIDK